MWDVNVPGRVKALVLGAVTLPLVQEEQLDQDEFFLVLLSTLHACSAASISFFPSLLGILAYK